MHSRPALGKLERWPLLATRPSCFSFLHGWHVLCSSEHNHSGYLLATVPEEPSAILARKLMTLASGSTPTRKDVLDPVAAGGQRAVRVSNHAIEVGRFGMQPCVECSVSALKHRETTPLAHIALNK